ncbi:MULTISPECIES: ATP-binding protein [unclassified Corallococcus]|uniref:ATP-binding protein n=1 Tax=unclassified Corallococcus TaxID=2685029 RepID=UPI001A8C5BDE|nr:MULTISPECIES: ATP-binding protein [unclassified Corallococcus]MBN9686435.1 ATP-binding protein [Corallococcus sp. NCSPR001]WAS82137.1 ATP-binding protein [Corallococcus sp. NCRR]
MRDSASPPGSALALARELVLLGAEAAVRERETTTFDAAAGFAHAPERFRELGERMRACLLRQDPMTARLRGRLGLSEEGTWLVVLAAAVEAHPECAAAASILAEDERVQLVTPAAFARLLVSSQGIPFERALAEAIEGGAAERMGLVERIEAAVQKPLAQVPVRLAPAEARRHLLADVPDVEPTQLAITREPPSQRLGLRRALVEGARAILDEEGVLCLRAGTARTSRQLGLDLASVAGETAFLVGGADEPPDAAEVMRLRGGLPVVDLHAACQSRPFPEPWIRMVSRHLPAVVLLVPHNAYTGAWPTVDLPELDLDARRRVFEAEFGEGPVAAALALRFRSSLDEVRAASRAATTKLRLAGGASNGVDAIAAELLAQGARKMGRLVTHIPSRAVFDDLVVPPHLRDTLVDIVGFYRAAPRVRAEMGLSGASPLGRGLSCLFSGSPGTGKTFAAQCLASALGLNLYRIDLSQVVSKYIGETEKALSRVFEEAEAGHGILLFDEADALFGKRSEVKDAHDRYANVEVAYLLQRMESFEGISILTTNLRSNMDTAFLRRLRFVLEFPMPDASMRTSLWQRSLPPAARWAPGLDLRPFVERFSLAGGSIYNIGVAAAHLAAAEPDGLVRIDHLVRATYRELEKVGLGRSREDFGPLAVHLPGHAQELNGKPVVWARGRA